MDRRDGFFVLAIAVLVAVSVATCPRELPGPAAADAPQLPWGLPRR